MKNMFVSGEKRISCNDKHKKISYPRFIKKSLSLESFPKKALSASFICLISSFLVACYNGNKRDYRERNGTVHCDKNMRFCLESVSGDWYSISNDAIFAVNKNSAFNFTIIYGAGGRDVSHFFTYSSIDNTNAYNQDVNYSGSKNIRNDIYYNTYYMDGYSYSEKRTIALHEMGHTLGLKDLKDERAKGYSVMYYAFGHGDPTFEYYPEYDKNNISWYYGGSWK